MGTHAGFIAGQAGHKYYLYLTIVIFFTVVFTPLADAEEAHEKHANEFHRHHAALIVGITQNDGNQSGLSVGVDYEYRFNRWIGLGGLAEYAGGDFDHFLLAVPLFIHPYKTGFFP